MCLLTAASFLCYQQVDDHSIIMADQTVIKKGELWLFFFFDFLTVRAIKKENWRGMLLYNKICGNY